jgi:hypothetical protein
MLDMRRFSLCVGAAAVITCAWFVISVKQAHDVDAANAILTASNGPLTAHQSRETASLIAAAGLLYPGQDVRILRARYFLKTGQDSRARSTLDAITRAEPDNLTAWLVVGALGIVQPRGFNVANYRKQLIRLDPVDARALSRF